MNIPIELDDLLNRRVFPSPIQLNPTDRLRTSLQHRLDEWQFVGKWFRQASFNTRMKKNIMGGLMWMSLKVGLVPSLTVAQQIIQDDEARVYSCFTAMLREIDAGIKLAEYGPVFKDFELDLTEGVDWLVGPIKVAIAHEGRMSQYYYDLRKRDKEQVDVRLIASGGSGVHLCQDFQAVKEIIHRQQTTLQLEPSQCESQLSTYPL